MPVLFPKVKLQLVRLYSLVGGLQCEPPQDELTDHIRTVKQYISLCQQNNQKEIEQFKKKSQDILIKHLEITRYCKILIFYNQKLKTSIKHYARKPLVHIRRCSGAINLIYTRHLLIQCYAATTQPVDHRSTQRLSCCKNSRSCQPIFILISLCLKYYRAKWAIFPISTDHL